MTGTSEAGIIVIMAVVLLAAMAMILWIFVVGGRGSFKHRRTEHRSGDVHGGIFVGDPGSVMPRRDAPRQPSRSDRHRPGQAVREDGARAWPGQGDPARPVRVSRCQSRVAAFPAMRREPITREAANHLEGTMSEFDKLKDDAEKYAQDHPDQVQKGEEAAEQKLGLPGQENSGSGQQDQSGQDQSGQGGPGRRARWGRPAELRKRRRPVARAPASRLAARPAGGMLRVDAPCTTARSPGDRVHLGCIVTGDGQNRGGAAGPPPSPERQAALLRAHDHLHRLVRHLVGGRGPLLSPRVGREFAGRAGHPAIRCHHRERDQRHGPPPPVTVQLSYAPSIS